MVNEKDLYSLSTFIGDDLIPNIDEYESQYYKNCGGKIPNSTINCLMLLYRTKQEVVN